jgi:hypothetical protein
MRIDVVATDPRKYRLNPLQVNLQMTLEAWKKIEQAHRTGEETTVGEEDLFSISSELFELLGLSGQSTPCSLTVSTPADVIDKRLRLRITFRKDDQRVEYSFVEMRPVRVGTQEIALRSVNPLGAFHLGLVIPVEAGSKARMTLHFSWEGCEIEKISRCCKAMSILHRGGTVEIFNLESDNILGYLKEPVGFDWIEDPGFHEFIDSLCEVSNATGTVIRWRRFPTQTDVRNARWLREIVSKGRLCLPGECITINFNERQLEAAVQAMHCGEGLRLLSNTPPEFAKVFDQTIDLGPFQLLILATELQVIGASVEQTDIREVQLKFEKPLHYIFDRFSGQEHEQVMTP